jgi:hypothetical protein
MERILAREGGVSRILYQRQVDPAGRNRRGSFLVSGVLAGLIIICALIGRPAMVAFAATQSIIALPEDTPDVPPPVSSQPPAAHPLPALPTREIVPRELHVPDESSIEPARPIELHELVKTAAPRTIEKPQRPIENALSSQSAAAVAQPSPPLSSAALPAASTPADRRGDQTEQGQFAEHTPPTAPALGAPAAPVSDLVVALIRRGDELLQLRDIAGARLLYERAALSGNAHAAMLAGKTYDPLYFGEIGISGIAPDRAKAMEWYGAATALGDAEATSRADKLRGLSKQ